MTYRNKTLHDALNEYFEDYDGKKWDGWEINIFPPVDLDSDACLEVHLTCADGTLLIADLAIGGAYNK